MSGPSYHLDTNAASSLIRFPDGPVARRTAAIGLGTIAISSVVEAELRFGAQKRGSPRLTALVEQLLSRVQCLAFDSPAAVAYAEIRDFLQRSGQPIGPNDLFIAAHALSLDATLVTNNVAEFSRVAGLRIEDWTAP
jgi:tRNA(fMet)-specific endonuclease VapC